MRSRNEVLAVCGAALLVIILSALVFGISRAQTAANEATQALCFQRAALVRTIDQEKSFLADPTTFPQFNTPSIIQLTKSQLAQNERDASSLRDVSC